MLERHGNGIAFAQCEQTWRRPGLRTSKFLNRRHMCSNIGFSAWTPGRGGESKQRATHPGPAGPPSAIFRHPLLIRAARRSECQAEAGQPRRAAEASLLSLPKAPFVSKLLIHGLTHSLSPGQLSRPTSLLGNYAPS